MLDYDHLFDDYDCGLDKFCEMFNIKLRPYQKKLIWLSTMLRNDSNVLIMTKDFKTKSYGTKFDYFVIDETFFNKEFRR